MGVDNPRRWEWFPARAQWDYIEDHGPPGGRRLAFVFRARGRWFAVVEGARTESIEVKRPPWADHVDPGEDQDPSLAELKRWVEVEASKKT